MGCLFGLDMPDIVKDNMQYFIGFFPQDRREDIIEGKMRGFGLIWEGTVVGAVGFYDNLSSKYIDWIYIAPEYRNKGLASTIVELLKIMSDNSQSTLQVSYDFEENDEIWNFWTKCGFEKTIDSTDVYFKFGDLKNSPYFKEGHNTEGVLSIKDALTSDLKFFIGNLKNEEKEFLQYEDLEDMNKELSIVAYNDKLISSILLIETENDSTIDVAYLYLDPQKGVKDFMKIFNKLYALAASMKIADDTVISAHCVNEKIQKLLDKLVDNKTIVNNYNAVMK